MPYKGERIDWFRKTLMKLLFILIIIHLSNWMNFDFKFDFNFEFPPIILRRRYMTEIRPFSTIDFSNTRTFRSRGRPMFAMVHFSPIGENFTITKAMKFGIIFQKMQKIPKLGKLLRIPTTHSLQKLYKFPEYYGINIWKL